MIFDKGGRRMSSKEHLVFCLPGNNISLKARESWTLMVINCMANAHKLDFSGKYTPIVHTTRSQIVGGNWREGKDQKPFKGELDYDHMVWIDSDQTPYAYAQVKRLIDHKKDIVAGWYATASMTHSCICENMDTEFRKKEGRWPLMKIEEVEKRKQIFEADFVGFGFIVIKRGVFEKIGYPWFTPIPRTEHNEIMTLSGEDEAFCIRAKKAGFKVWIDPTVRVGHEKTYIV